MFKKTVGILSAFSLSLFVLAVSVQKSSSAEPRFSVGTFPILAEEIDAKINIDYILPYPGKILPDSPLWFIKVLRDKAIVLFERDPIERAESKLLFADKRLLASKTLFENGKPDLALSTLTKAEKYLEEAQKDELKERMGGNKTIEFLKLLSKASLKHREVSDEIARMSPEDIRPEVIKIQDYPKNVYKETRDALLSMQEEPPQSPFHD